MFAPPKFRIKMTQHKSFKHKEVEECALSKKKIDTMKDDYSIILDCRGEEIKSIKFYKTELLRDLIKEKGEKVTKALLERTQNLAGNTVSNVLTKIGLIKPTYEVK